jgi:hypothetical protein
MDFDSALHRQYEKLYNGTSRGIFTTILGYIFLYSKRRVIAKPEDVAVILVVAFIGFSFFFF